MQKYDPYSKKNLKRDNEKMAEQLNTIVRKNSILVLEQQHMIDETKKINVALEILDNYATSVPNFWLNYAKYISDNGLRDKARLKEEYFNLENNKQDEL